MMTKAQLIESTLQAMHNACGFSDELDAVVIATLKERLPEGAIKTCEDLSLPATCCDICHTFYPHCEMYLETLESGDVAWICCRVHSELRNSSKSEEERLSEMADLKEALGGVRRELTDDALQIHEEGDAE